MLSLSFFGQCRNTLRFGQFLGSRTTTSISFTRLTFRIFRFLSSPRLPALRLVDEPHVVLARQVAPLVSIIQLPNPPRIRCVAARTKHHRSSQRSQQNVGANPSRAAPGSPFPVYGNRTHVEPAAMYAPCSDGQAPKIFQSVGGHGGCAESGAWELPFRLNWC